MSTGSGGGGEERRNTPVDEFIPPEAAPLNPVGPPPNDEATSDAEEHQLTAEELKGPIAWMARNHVAANLLMLICIVGGLIGAFFVKQEVFPEFDLDVVRVTVPYPGASPTEVEQGIVLAVEEELRGIDGVKHVTSSASEGSGTVVAELNLGVDQNSVLADIKGAVDRIQSFPEDSEKPTVKLEIRRRAVIQMVLAGDLERTEIHAIGERAREKILDSADVTQVELGQVPPLEVSIEIPRETLESYGLSLPEVANQVSALSLELPGGELETKGGELLVRVSDRRLSVRDFEDLKIRGTKEGYTVRLGDIAKITDGFRDTDQEAYYDGKPALTLTAYRTGDETPKAVAAAVLASLEELKQELPPGVKIHVLDDDSETLNARLNLLKGNAFQGFVLVLIILALFLKLRLAGWVSLGIPISFLGALALMPALDISVNMVTSFAFIVTLGMLVDDAIVVGENIYTKQQQGVPPLKAAIVGAKEMAVPVTFAILTTVAAFAPLYFVPGMMGKIFRFIPIIVCITLAFSLVESFFVLPAHLSGRPGKPLSRRVDRGQQWVSKKLEWLIERTYRPVVTTALNHRYIAVACGLAALILTFGLLRAGFVPFSFFPKLEGNKVTAFARLPYGAPEEARARVRQQLEKSAEAAIEQLGGRQYVLGVYTRLGEGPEVRGSAQESSGNLVTIDVNLVPSDQRSFSSNAFAAAWSKTTPVIAGVDALTFNGGSGPGAGQALNVQLSHSDAAVLERASEDLTESLRGFSDLNSVQNTYAAGKPQLDFHLLPAAQTFGLTAGDVGRQLRGAFFGAEALREQRGRNELRVMVRLPPEQRSSEYDLEKLLIKTPEGGNVPLGQVASFDRNRAPTAINREDGRRIVNVTAELAPGVRSVENVLTALDKDVYPKLMATYPGLRVDGAGQQRSQAEAMGSLGRNFVLSMLAIYVLLAIPFRSYFQPIIVMSVIPFGFVGAVLGHLLMGYELSISSMFGLIALSGVVVNDSLVLVHATNEYRVGGMTAFQAMIEAGVRRFRPILLTSVTTAGGLLPMITETDRQARFLIPMAISLGFGILVATVIVLVLVPSLYMILEDVRAFYFGPERARGKLKPSPAE